MSCTTSPTNGPTLPADDPTFVVKASFHDPLRRGDDEMARFLFILFNWLIITSISPSLVGSLEIDMPFCVSFVLAMRFCFSSSTEARLEADDAKGSLILSAALMPSRHSARKTVESIFGVVARKRKIHRILMNYYYYYALLSGLASCSHSSKGFSKLCLSSGVWVGT